jgi:hypothetical protein
MHGSDPLAFSRLSLLGGHIVHVGMLIYFVAFSAWRSSRAGSDPQAKSVELRPPSATYS